MACIDFVNLNGQRNSGESYQSWYDRVIKDNIYQQGFGCMLKYPGPCKDVCTQLSKNPDGCYSCLTNGYSCFESGTSVAVSPIPCCPGAGAAMVCSNCLSAYGNDGQGLERCLRHESKSKKLALIIGLTVGAILLIIIIAVTVVTIRRNQAKERLALKVMKTNPQQAQQILELQNVDESVFHNVEKQLAKSGS